MDLRPLQFQSQGDLSDAIRRIFPIRSTRKQALRTCIVATNGHTYLLEDVHSFAGDEADQLEFATKQGETVSIAIVKKALMDGDEEVLDNLVYNTPLVEMLEKVEPFSLYKTPLPYSDLNPNIPILFPVLTSEQVSYDYHDIKNKLRWYKSHGTTAKFRKKGVLSNIALQELILFCIDEAERIHASNLDSLQQGYDNELAAHEAKVDVVLSQKTTAIQARLMDIKSQAQAAQIQNLPEFHQRREKLRTDLNSEKYIRYLESKSNAEIKQKIRKIHDKQNALEQQNKNINKHVGITASALFIFGVAAMIPLMIFLTPAAGFLVFIPFVISATIVSTGNKYLEKNLVKQTKNKKKLALAETQLKANKNQNIQTFEKSITENLTLLQATAQKSDTKKVTPQYQVPQYRDVVLPVVSDLSLFSPPTTCAQQVQVVPVKKTSPGLVTA